MDVHRAYLLRKSSLLEWGFEVSIARRTPPSSVAIRSLFFAPGAEEKMGKLKTGWLRVQMVGRKFKWLMERDSFENSLRAVL